VLNCTSPNRYCIQSITINIQLIYHRLQKRILLLFTLKSDIFKQMKKISIVIILFLFTSFLNSDWWTITDWSDSTGIDTIVNLNGTRQPGNLILDAPDIWNWEYMVSLQDAQNVYDMVISFDSTIYAATGDNNGDVFKSVNLGEHWDTTANISLAKWVYGLLYTSDNLLYAASVKGNLSSYVAFTNNPDSGWNSGNALQNGGSYEKGVHCVVEAQNYLFCGAGFYLTTGANIYSSDKGTANWTFKTGFGDNQVLCMDAINLQTIIAGTGNSKGYILRSSDGGENWLAIDSLNCAIEALAGNEDGVCFLGTNDGRVFASTDSGLTWSETSSLPEANVVKSLSIDDKGIIYAGGNATGNRAEVYFSKDKGNSWDSSGNISDRSNILSLLGLENGFLLAGTNIDASIFRAAYFHNGYLISKPFYTGTSNESTKYGIIQWEDSLNEQDIVVKVRTDTSLSMSSATPWGFVLPVSNGDSISKNSAVNDGDSYIQYYVEFGTQDAGISPVMDELSIEYSVDTIGPIPIFATACDGEIQQNGIDEDDYVVITFDEKTTEPTISPSTIDSLLKLSPDTCYWGADNIYWSSSSGPARGEMSYLIIELTHDSLSNIWPGVWINPDTIIKDVWENSVFDSVKLKGSFDDTVPPIISSAFASDSLDSIQGIDNDDYVRLVFDQPTDTPQINQSNINTVLKLSEEHTWGDIDGSVWNSSGEILTILLNTDGTPTIEVGDTIYPDSETICDVNNNPCFSPRVIAGTFGDYGPVIDSAVAYDGNYQQNGIDYDDYVYLYFNKETNAPTIDSTNVNQVLKLNNNHTWLPVDFIHWTGNHKNLYIDFKDSDPTVEVGDTIYPDSITIIDFQGQPCIHPVVLTGSFNPGVVESKNKFAELPTKLDLKIHPNPCKGVINIVYSIPVRKSVAKMSETKIDLYDIAGRKIKNLISTSLSPEQYSYTLRNKSLKHGIYFIKITSGGKTLTRKLTYLK
jgi:photosystem II stability/assembly factor-like uncharacterized protein